MESLPVLPLWHGHLEVLKYAHEDACPWNEYTTEAAAEAGHLEVLKYAREGGCPWDERTYLRFRREVRPP